MKSVKLGEVVDDSSDDDSTDASSFDGGEDNEESWEGPALPEEAMAVTADR